MQNKLKYACIGAGGIADKKHLNEYSKLNAVEITAICDCDIEAAKRLAEKYKIPHVYTDYKAMLAEQRLDLVSICTPNFLHAEICIDALEAGVNVHCEKPLALNAEEVLNIIEEKNKSGKKLMVALNNRFTNEAAHIYELIEKDFFGEIYHAKCGWKRNSGIPGIGRWFTDKKLSGGGPLIDLGVHFLDLALYFMQFPRAVSVYAATYSAFGRDADRIRVGYKSIKDGVFNVEDTAVGFIRLENDATIDFDFSWASNIEKEQKYVELLGTKGGLSFVNGEIKLYSQIGNACYTLTPDTKTIPLAQNECRHFVECIISNKEPSASVEQAYELMKIIDSAYDSASKKKEVRLTSKMQFGKYGQRILAQSY
ncbi:putative dehydrogenase [Anaerobacterium chartisolvens]|uniref:Putative dehydrogenase n=1 Tax=Anaerobacterium chartisolvens TaxID=1297424 RepID=A0A369B382_9FIRM|nr:Gfo/Idh/MocA family oxidoreductase [Anaerobacterium chartisolvens]RCX16060.1 putative dehydrogenase [Anaerobacterium chartisolvens]